MSTQNVSSWTDTHTHECNHSLFTHTHGAFSFNRTGVSWCRCCAAQPGCTHQENNKGQRLDLTHTHTHLPTHTLTERYIYTSEYFAGRQHTLRREDNPLHRLNLNLQPFLFDNWQIGRHLGGLSSSTVFIWTHTHTHSHRENTLQRRRHGHTNTETEASGCSAPPYWSPVSELSIRGAREGEVDR